MKLNNSELLQIKGGASLSATMMNALARTIQIVYNIGYGFGSSIKRLVYKKNCRI